MARRSAELLVPLLASSSPATLDQLQNALGPVSRRTAFRYLKQVRYLRSYNHNGRFYTARDPSRFDRFGLFSLGDAHFSRDRSLSATVRRLLSESSDGWTEKELRSLLHVPAHPFLLAAVRGGQARRERLAGVYVYFCRGPRGERQRQGRQARLAAGRAGSLEPATIIEVLLVLVRHPACVLPEQVARRLRGHVPPVPLRQVRAVFDRFDLAGRAQKGGSTAC